MQFLEIVVIENNVTIIKLMLDKFSKLPKRFILHICNQGWLGLNHGLNQLKKLTTFWFFVFFFQNDKV